uniref:MARVEL domain-containing protein n=1 Tax=Cacopsylla melanoneura TaxID=428564 RepID=A0A8D8QV64_9HEMI
MQCTKYIQSLSDLYSVSDEISILLEEINHLEPNSYCAEDLQDFEIAGSQTGSRGGRGPGSIAELETPGDATTVHSWDSHAHYKHHLPGDSPTHSIFSGVVLVFDETHLKSSIGFIRLLLVVTSVLCAICMLTAGTAHLGVFILDGVLRIRFMLFVILFSLLITFLFLFLDISHIIYLFPFNWGKVNACFYVGICVFYLIASSVLIHLVYEHYQKYTWIPHRTTSQLVITAILGYVCALEALLLALLTRCDGGQYSPVTDDPSSINLQERRGGPDPILPYTPSPSPASMTPGAPSNQWPLDDAQPCSSRA